MTKFIHLSFASALLCLLGIFNAHGVSALTYQSSERVKFTFNPSISIDLSGDLVINNLTPGSSADSNIITVTVSTNNDTGYVLTASVGDAGNATTNLINGNYNFASIATNASLASLATDNTWGYSFSNNNGATWTNYSGLPLYTSANWKEIASTNTKGTINLKFKIGAKASTSQASGIYANVINFTAVANPGPMGLSDAYAAAGKTKLNGYYKMQDMTPQICSMVELTEDEIQAIDIRDNKVYWIAKLADGKCWMVQNLDLDIDENTTYTPADTDIETNWTPDTSTSTTAFSTYNPTIEESYDPGNLYWNGTLGGSDTNFNDMVSASGDAHYHIGNYYNWPAAVAENDTEYVYGTSTGEADQSICPAGWTLPATFGDYSDSYDLLDTYGFLSNAANIWNNPIYLNYSGAIIVPLPSNSAYEMKGGRFWGNAYTYYYGIDCGESGEDCYNTGELFYIGTALEYVKSNAQYYATDWDYAERGLTIRCIARPRGANDTIELEELFDHSYD